jgi:DNA mismatch repair protein MutH
MKYSLNGRELMRKINTLNDLHEISELLTGKSFAEIDKKNTDPNKKGYFGNVVQESGFGLPKDNAAEADFSFLGVELKVTPYKQNKNESYSAKERLVANIIDYMSEFTADKFEES